MPSLIKPRPTGNKPAPSSPQGGGRFKFEYRPRSQEEVRTYVNSIGGRDGYFPSEIPFFTPRVGDNIVRILPPPPGSEWGHFGVKLHIHYGIGVDENPYLCLAKMKNEACPICEERERASRAGEGDLSDALRPRTGCAVFVIDRGQENKGPMLWTMPTTVDKEVSKQLWDPTSGEVLLVDHPEEGFDLSFSREGQGLKTKYGGFKFSRRSSPLHDDPKQAEAWLKFICDHAIDKSLVYYEASYIEGVLTGQPPPKAREEREEKPGAGGEGPKRFGSGRSERTQESGGTGAAEPAARPKIQPRGAKAAPAPAAAPPAEEASDKPTWEQLEAMDEEQLAEVGDAFEIKWPDEEGAFESIEQLRDFVAEAIEVAKPEPEPAPAPKGGTDWKSRLANMTKKK